MAATDGSNSGSPASWEDRYKWIAGHLADRMAAARPKPDGFMPGSSMPAGQDVPRPQGLYTAALIAPGEWPEASESGLAQYGQSMATWARKQDDANSDANAQVAEVLNGSWVSGDAWAAADEHYAKERIAHDTVVDAGKAVAAGADQLSEFMGSTKGRIRQAHDAAHRKIEATLRSANGAPIGIGPIVSEYRPLIAGWSAELHQSGQDATTMLTDKFGIPEAPPGHSSDGHQPDDAMPTDGPVQGDPQGFDPQKKPGGSGVHDALPDGGPSQNGTPNTNVGAARGGEDALPTLPGGLPGSGKGMPSMPSMPSAGGSGGGSSPLSSLSGMQGLMGGGKGLTGPLNNISPAALQGGGPASGAMSPASLGQQFRQGMAAGANAAGAMPPISPPPQAPTTPLAAPISPAGGAPAAGAPAGAPTTFAAGGNAGNPAVASGGAPAGGMAPTSYGSVLPPSAMPPAAAGGGGGPVSIGGAPPPPPVTGGAGTPPSTGFMPVRDEGAPQQVARSVSMTDLELARVAVADLAAASSVVYPGLEWAVVVSRGSSGVPEMWVTSNEGAGYIPAGVHVRRSMPLAARFDDDFDARWFGWFNPAETALRAVRARGGAVSAIATTWPQRSELVSASTPDVAIAVAPSSAPGDAEASQLLNSRSHRLETVAPGIYQSLERAEQHVAEGYARQLTQESAFGGPELSSVAQSVARGLISSRWPSNEEWAALRTEYEMERLMAGSQRPGLQGIEEPDLLVGYVRDFVHCRRLETLLCWQDGTPADVVYAAATAGVSLNPLPPVASP
jgi:hypothetical protein